MMGTALENLGRLLLRYFSKCSSQLKLVFTGQLKFNSEAKERMLIHSLFDLKGGTMTYYKPDNLPSSLPLGSNYYTDNYLGALDSLSRSNSLDSVLLVSSGTST